MKLEDRLVKFASNIFHISKDILVPRGLEYYGNQILRSSGSAALNFGEALATITNKDFIFKCSLTRKELYETKIALRIIQSVLNFDPKIGSIQEELEELIKISNSMILNAKKIDK